LAKRKKPLRRNFYSPKRRAVYAQGDEINHLELFEKHNWICGICCEAINKRLRFPNLLAATVDHIIPISKGGTHTWTNTRPAHAKCNFTKGNLLVSEDDGIIAA